MKKDIITDDEGYIRYGAGPLEIPSAQEPLKLYRKISKSARGLILRIPTDIERNMELKGDEEVAITKVNYRTINVEFL